jgi:hypothetical protein
MKITKERFVKEWIKDLTSGKYQQCGGQLSVDNKYCCLGVACKTGQRLGIKEAEFTKNFKEYSQIETSEKPGKWLEEILGTSCPDIPDENGHERDAILRNDIDKWSFKEIADGLKRKYLDNA